MTDPSRRRDYGIDYERNTYPKMRSARAHFAYLHWLLRHKWFVLCACRRTGTSLWRGIVHDLSKFRPSEWFAYLRSFYNFLGDQHYEPDPGLNHAWLLHQRRNPHHWQAWILRFDEGGSEALPMPEAFAREMVADWIGAGMAISGRVDPRPWYERNKHNIELHPETRDLVERIMEGLGKGNDS
jgi:hypothetical protein